MNKSRFVKCLICDGKNPSCDYCLGIGYLTTAEGNLIETREEQAALEHELRQTNREMCR